MRDKIQSCLHICIPNFLHFHHIDNNRNNNTLENIIILDRKLHRKIHAEIRKDSFLTTRKELKRYLRENHYSHYMLIPVKSEIWVTTEVKGETPPEEIIKKAKEIVK